MAEVSNGARNTKNQEVLEVPELKRLGTLSELTQAMAGAGNDGGVAGSTMVLK